MKKFNKVLIASVAVVLILVTTLVSGCKDNELSLESSFRSIDTTEKRFSLHETNLNHFYILVDGETGVQYLLSGTDKTMCPLLNADGTPLVVELESDE